MKNSLTAPVKDPLLQDSGTNILKNKSKAALTDTGPVQTTLNGYAQNVAVQMIQNFADNSGNYPGSKSVCTWYSAAELNDIYNLLVAEEVSVGTDGVRFYFGCDEPAAGANTLNLSIFMVSTQPQTPVNDSESEHADYYTHTADFLSAGTTGAAVNDNAAAALAEGALLYEDSTPSPEDTCARPSKHYLDIATAYHWTRNRCELSNTNAISALNTESEWFGIRFIKALFYSIVNDTRDNLDGMRIYLGQGYNFTTSFNIDGRVRDVLILVPTYDDGAGNHVDFYNCLEQLGLATFDRATKPAQKTLAASAQRKDNSDYKKSLKMKHPFITRYGGGYDEGELCPDVCK